MDVFDLTRNPDQIGPAWSFFLIFVAIDLGLLGGILYFALCLRRKAALFYLPLVLAMAAGAIWMTWYDIRHARAVKAQIASGHFASVEGCLDWFKPGLASPHEADSGLERWAVAGRTFDYAADEVRFGYHLVEPGGGIVHADSWVRVGYIPDKVRGYNDIVRLEVRQRACPAAPNPY
ncbi:MAG: hypothetical protein J7499_00845 [Sphingopyxis sp.]|nr:hypothetical protein [Sphingopyxis sp.]